MRQQDHEEALAQEVMGVAVMGKRYLYWRTAEGVPYRRDDGKHTPTATLATLGKLASVKAGEHSYSLPCFPQRYHIVLRSAAVILDPDENELNETDSWAIIIKAVTSAIVENGGGKPISPETLGRFADELSAEFFRQPVQEFVCVTTLSTADLPIEPIEIGDCKVWKLSSRREQFCFPESLGDHTEGQRFDKHQQSTKYLRVAVDTKGRTIFEAADRALDALNLLRGLWMLCDTLGRWTVHFGFNPYKPIGGVLLGPIHTLHHPDGSLAIDNFWYEPDYLGDQPLFDTKKGWDELEKFRSWASQEIEKHKYRQDVQQLLRRLSIAFSQADPNTAFLQLWCILERITDTVGKKYDDTIERAVWPYADRFLMKEQLEHLRYRRNQYVHSAKSDGEMDQTVLLAKSFVEQHLLRLIRNDCNVDSLEEYGRFLSLPTNVDTLKRRREHLDRAIQIRAKKEAST
jgi:hypothetical protein